MGHSVAAADARGNTWTIPASSSTSIAGSWNALRDVAEASVAVEPVVGAPSCEQYRNVGKYVVGYGEDGAITLGAYAPRSHNLVSTLDCAVVEPVISATANALVPQLRTSGLSVYDEATREGELRYAVLRGNHQGQVLAGIVTTSAASEERMTALAQAIAEDPRVIGVVWIRNDTTGGALLSGDRQALTGADVLVDQIGGLDLEVSIRSFFQVNRDQASRMYGFIADAVAQPDAHIADVYCGVGGIALTLGARGAQAIGIERNGEAVDAARRASHRNGMDELVHFARASAEHLARLEPAPDTVVVNPPRKGLDAETRAAVLAVSARRLVYVSCNPDSLARDLRVLAAGGYAIKRIAPFDLMPGTAQVETVVLCRSTKPDK